MSHPARSTMSSDDPKMKQGKLKQRMPAEWETHSATLLAWPHNRATWPSTRLDAVERVYLSILKELIVSDHVLLLCGVEGSPLHTHVQKVLQDSQVDLANVTLVPFQTNDVWARDYGPINVFVEDSGKRELLFLNWIFNSWGGKYPPFDSDNAIPPKLANRYSVPVKSIEFVLEGGSIDVNGSGTLLTTESVLLNPNRNPSYGKDEIEELLTSELGLEQVIWLKSGLEGDDTDGHIDDLARFIDPKTILCCVSDDPNDPNYETLQQNLTLLHEAKDLDGLPFRIIPLPMPDTRTEEQTVDGSDRVPASYANFYMANGRILVPLYDAQTDEVALSIFKECAPGFDVVGIPCRDLVWGQGSIHCITQQIYGL